MDMDSLGLFLVQQSPRSSRVDVATQEGDKQFKAGGTV